MPDKIKGPLFLEAESTLRVPAWLCLPKTLLEVVWTIPVFPFATLALLIINRNSNTNNNNETPQQTDTKE